MFSRTSTLLVIFQLMNFFLFSQKTEYFTIDWKPTTRDNAEYYRIITYDKFRKPVGQVRDFYMTGKLFFEGQMTSTNPQILEGLCSWYYLNGQLRRQGTFKNGELAGKLRVWSIDGKEEGVLDDTGFFYSSSYLQRNLSRIGRLLKHEISLDSAGIYSCLRTGSLFINKNELESSILLYQLAHDIASILERESEKAITYHNLGYVWRKRGDFEMALTWYRKAIGIWENTRAENQLAVSYNNLGIVLDKLNRYVEALDWYFKAITVQEQLGLTQELANTFHNIGYNYIQQAKYIEALEWYNKAIFLQKNLGLEAKLATSYNNIGFIHNQENRFKEAIAWYQKAIEIREQLSFDSELTGTYDKMGEVYLSLGQNREALIWFHRGKDLQKQLGHSFDLAKSYNKIGNIYHNLGEYTESFSWYTKAYEIFEQFENGPELISVYNNIGTSFFSQNQFTESLKWFRKAEIICERLKLEEEAASTYGNIGYAYQSQKLFSAALDYHQRAKEIQEKLGDSTDLARTYTNIGYIHFAGAQYSSATFWYRRAIEMFEKLQVVEGLYPSYSNIAYAYYYKSKYDSTLFYVQKYFNLVGDFGDSWEGSVNSQLNARKNLGVLEIGIEATLQLKDYKKAIYFSQLGKLKRLNAIFSTYLQQSARSSFLKDRSEKVKSNLQGLDQYLLGDLDYDKRAKLILLRDSLQQEKWEINDLIKLISPKISKSLSLEVTALEKIQTVLNEDEALISYFLGNQNVFAGICTRADFEILNLGNPSPLADTLGKLRESLIAKGTPDLILDELGSNKNEAFFRFSNSLYEKLWAPLDSTGLIRGKKIILIPDGFLNYLPFELLIKDKEQKDYQDYQYLIQDHPISYYPSSTLLHFERTKEGQENIPERDFFGLGVSEFKNTNCTNDDNIYGNLVTIASSIDRLGDLFSINQSTTIVDDQANESAFKSLDLTNYRYLHFATHGVINDETPDFSSILLQPGAQEDGCLNMYEIFDLDFNADLVTLAACQTGLGKLVRGEGMVGFTRALMYAGTPSVILSLWEVADESTNQLFLDYYSKLAKDGSDKYAPLRAAQLDMIKSREYSNPYYWAPFVFIGARESKF